MNNDYIINMYKHGHSIDFITNEYYKFINRNVGSNRFINGELFIPKKKIKKDEARLHVSKVIYNYVMELF